MGDKDILIARIESLWTSSSSVASTSVPSSTITTSTSTTTPSVLPSASLGNVYRPNSYEQPTNELCLASDCGCSSCCSAMALVPQQPVLSWSLLIIFPCLCQYVNYITTTRNYYQYGIRPGLHHKCSWDSKLLLPPAAMGPLLPWDLSCQHYRIQLARRVARFSNKQLRKQNRSDPQCLVSIYEGTTL